MSIPTQKDADQVLRYAFDDQDNALRVDATISGSSISLFTKPYDAITATYPSATQEVYQTRIGGIAGTVQETVTVNYVDATKEQILNVART